MYWRKVYNKMLTFFTSNKNYKLPFTGLAFSRQLQIVRFHIVFRTSHVAFMVTINFYNSLVKTVNTLNFSKINIGIGKV